VSVVLAGCVADAPSDDAIPDPSAFAVPDVPAVDAAALLADLQSFAATYSIRASNTADHEGARDWLAAQFESSGLTVWRHDFETDIPQQNIVGIKWGEVRDEWVVVGGHYDMVTTDCIIGSIVGLPEGTTCVTRPLSQGAYDDGSGTMMTVHLAKAFADVPTYYSIAFVAFDGEERGLQGSGAFAEAIVDDAIPDGLVPGGHVRVRGMLDLDMIGLNWPGVDAPIYFDANAQGLRDVVEQKRVEQGMPDDMIEYTGISLGRSDYAHFFDMGVPTGFLISDFEKWQLPADLPYTVQPSGLPIVGAYPFWHLEDTYETMTLMAGSAEDLQAGFQTAVDIAATVTHALAAQPLVAFSVVSE
jgi:Zn-dependent M28 family amino/carboxypeptidase